MFLLEDCQAEGSTGSLWSHTVSRFPPLEDDIKSFHNLLYLYPDAGGV